jgi:ABC-type amino acid transport substrate-binding protein
VVGVEELDYYPLYAVRDGEYVGAVREILDAFAKEAGIRFRYQPLPIMRLFSGVLDGSLDFKFPDSPDWKTDLKTGKPLHYSQGVIAYVDGVMVRPDRLGKGLEQFHTLGTVTGFTPFSWLSQLESGQVNKVENPQMRALQRQVIAGRIDGAYASIAVANHILEQELKSPGALVFDADLPHTRSTYQLSTARHPELIERFNQWLDTSDDKVTAIKQKFAAEKGVR